MYLSSDVPALACRDAFASWARITVEYVDGASAMPLTRLDRRGLTVAADAADWPTIGLPRRARIIADSTSLCELRLVARAAVPVDDATIAVTLQPSRADDDALLWQALRAYHIHVGTVPVDEGSQPLAGLAAWVTASRGSRDASSQGTVCMDMDAAAREPGATRLTASTIHTRSRISSDVAFTLGSREDAWFFSHWLDYHFAEARAWARTNDAAADLREIFMRTAEHEVEVRFVFESPERIVRASTETACRCIATEAGRQLGMTIEYWLASTASVLASPASVPRRAVIGARQ